MHDRLFAAQDRLDLPALEEHARALALDVPRFRAALDGAKFKARVDADLKLAKDADISGTPTFFINGERLAGAQPLSAFVHQVETALAKLKGLPPPAKPAREPLPPLAQRAPMFVPSWPPVAITLPDNLLGDRVSVRFATGNAPVRGNPRGPVEVLYFTNLNAFEGQAIAKGLLSTHASHVKLVAKVVPTLYGPPPPLGPKEPELLSAVAHYAHSQGKFWEFHDALKPSGRAPEREQIEQIAQSVGLDLADLRAALDEKRFQPAMEQDREAIRAAKLEGPFAFVVNGRHAESPVALAQLVDAAIRRAGRKPPARPPSPIAVVTNPADPAYEPQRLMQQMSMRQLFGHEPRDSAWATAVEKQLGPLIDRDLRGIEPALASTNLECRSRLCRLRWKPGKGSDMAIATGARTLYPSFGRPTPGEMYMALRSGTVRTVEDSISRIEGRRNTVLYNYRTGRATQKLPFPVERLPEQ
jgi:predicted DsbA family dithiol-disulfide isomerase